jgi:hypothetical protein
MTVAMLQYAQGSPLQKEALEHAELFYGIIMYQHMAMLPLDSFMDALLDSVVKYNDLKTFIMEVKEYVNLVFIQVQETWTPEMRLQFTRRARGNNQHDQHQELYDFLSTSDPQAKETFNLVLRKKGQDHIRTMVDLMDKILVAESERQFWLDNHLNTNRLLWMEQPLEIPERQADFLSTLFWYELYLAQEEKQALMNRFLKAMSRLTLIRVYAENRATGLKFKHMESQIDPIDLKQLKENGLAGISQSNGDSAGATFTDYTSILELARGNGTLVDYSPDLADYMDDEDDILSNESDGVNNIKYTAEWDNNSREKRDLYTRQQVRVLVKRTADNLLGNLTADNTLLNELNIMMRDPSRSRLIRKRFALGDRPLTLFDLFKLQDDLSHQNDRETHGPNTLRHANNEYLADVLSFAKQHYIPAEILALLLEPEHVVELPQAVIIRLRAAQRVLKIKPLPNLVEKKALLAYLKSNEKATPKAKKSFWGFNAGFWTLYFLLVIACLVSQAFVYMVGKIYRMIVPKYQSVNTNVPIDHEEITELNDM